MMVNSTNMVNEILDKIISELRTKAEQLKEISADNKDSIFLSESVGILKSIDIIEKYKIEVNK